MPIRINLLAEAHALEDLRRRDPVKRVVLAGIALVLLILCYSSSLLVQTMAVKSDVNKAESSLNSRTNQNEQILLNKRNLDDARLKLSALYRLSTNRFLVGNLLDALQKTTVDNVQLVRMKLDQTYQIVEESKSTNGDRTVPKPASITEKIVLTLNAKDNSSVPGDAVKKYQDALSAAPYSQDLLGKNHEFRLTLRSAPQSDPEGRSFVLFTLEGRAPEKSR